MASAPTPYAFLRAAHCRTSAFEDDLHVRYPHLLSIVRHTSSTLTPPRLSVGIVLKPLDSQI